MPLEKELREMYTPTPTDVAFVTNTAGGAAQKFGLMILLRKADCDDNALMESF